MRQTALAVICCVALVVAGCGQVKHAAGSTVPATRGQGSTSALPSHPKLPFESVHPHRWSSANDGSDYEPCVALTAERLKELGVDTQSVRDAAGTDGQTLRGCQWSYRVVDGARWAVSQVVANSAGLEEYKKKYSDDKWIADQVIAGRTVGVTNSSDLGQCMTYVQSGRAGITTLVIHHRLPHPPVDEVCERAIEFTKATIDKMPR